MGASQVSQPEGTNLNQDEALVLSGGGTKGVFEIGALEYLTRNADYAPGIITGTSAGSLIAGPLAQGSSGADLKALTQVVRQNALSVTDISVVFGEQEWLTAISDTPLGELVHNLISVRTRPELPGDQSPGQDPLQIPEPRRRHRTLYAMSTALANSTKLVRASRELFANGNSIMNLVPLQRGYQGEAEVGVARLDESLVADSGVTLRLAISSMRTGRPRYVTESGHIVEEDGVSVRPGGGRPGVIEGMLASSSVPMMFPPRRIGDDIYCDGGLVQNTPLEVAVRAGAKNAIAILAGPLEITPDDTDYTKASLAAVYVRAASAIGPNEVQHANLRYPLPDAGELTVIAPTVDVLGGFEVEAGLLEIDFDYGWLRAAEATADLTEASRMHLQQLSDQIAAQRERAWFLEDRIISTGHRLDVAGALRHARALTVVACQDWLTSGLPPKAGMDRWGYDWELHSQEVHKDLVSVGRVG